MRKDRGQEELALYEELKQIGGPDRAAMELAAKRWSHVAKPLNSLGLLEETLVQIAGMTGDPSVSLEKKAVAVFCGDNGVVEEGVTQTGQEVTAIVAENFSKGDSCVCIMAETAGADVFPVDMGVCRLLHGYGEFQEGRLFPVCLKEEQQPVRYPILNRRVMDGTRNFTKAPAMDRETAARGIREGIALIGELKKRGYGIVATGEMGIGNTTTSSAVISVLLRENPERVTGRGAGLSSEGLNRKLEAIRTGIRLWRPDPEDGLDVLAKVGGLDLAGMTGAFLGGAIYGLPVVVDGLISSAAALLAVSICPACAGFMLASHVSAEPAGHLVLEKLGLKPIIHGKLCLGEGTGAVALFPLLDMAAAVYHKMSTFSEIQIEDYRPLS